MIRLMAVQEENKAKLCYLRYTSYLFSMATCFCFHLPD